MPINDPQNFSFILDSVQTRIQLYGDRLSTLVSTDEWCKSYISNAYVEPVNKVAMLQPYPLTPEWSNTYNGNYARYQLSDYNLTTSKWIASGIGDANDGFIKYIGSDNTPEQVITKATQPKNGSMWLSWYAANANTEKFVQMTCGWGSGSSSDPLTMKFYSDGLCEIYRSGEFSAAYNYTGSAKNDVQNGFPSQTAHQYIYVLIMPYRNREILILSNRGAGFSYLLDDLDQFSSNNVMIPEGKFWMQVPSGMAQIASAPCLYQTDGYICGAPTIWAHAPLSSDVLETNTYGSLHGGSATVTLCQPNDPTSGWSPDGSITNCMTKLALHGNGITTPTIYGMRAGYPTLTTSTTSAPIPLDDYVTEGSLEVDGSITGTKVNFRITSPDEASTIAPRIRTLSNRPFTLMYGGVSILTGVTEAPKYTDSLNDDTAKLEFEIRDKWKLLEHYAFTDPTPLDGMELSAAMTYILKAAGIPSSQINIEPTDFYLPQAEGITSNEFAVMINAGDTAAEWIKRLHENYASNWMLAIVPTGGSTQIKIVSTDTLGTESVYTLYDTNTAAESNGADATNRHTLVYRKYKESLLEPEANSIWVQGRDPVTNKPLLGYTNDDDSQNPELSAESAPSNWLGEIRKYGLVDASISSQDALNRAVTYLSDRLTPSRTIAEFESDFMIKSDGVPVWVGDVITLNGRGDYRIKSIRTQIKRDLTETGWYWRPTTYTAELEEGNGIAHHGGVTLEQVVARHQIKTVTKTTVRKDQASKDLQNQRPIRSYLF